MQFLYENYFFIIFSAIILCTLLIDLLYIGKDKHEISLKESVIWTSVWICMALLFYLLIYFYGHKIHNINSIENLNSYLSKYSPHIKVLNQNFADGLSVYRKSIATDYITGYLLEYTLSIDNIFVILMILTGFSVNPKYYKTILFWGILGAIVLRFLFIFIGSALVTKYEWILYVFGAFLIYSGISMFLGKDHEEKKEVKDHFLVKFLSKHFNVHPVFAEHHFWIKINGKLFITPLLIVLILIEFTDLIFAFDSIPAIFSITRDPYIVFYSNIFAILGLRSLFFLLIKIIEYFRYLKIGISVLLAFIGVKLLFHNYLDEIGFKNYYSLLFILTTLTLCIVASLIIPNKKNLNKKN